MNDWGVGIIILFINLVIGLIIAILFPGLIVSTKSFLPNWVCGIFLSFIVFSLTFAS